MKLCTIVTEAAWLSILEKGYLVRSDPAHMKEPDYLPAYEWMSEQMAQRIGPPPPEAKLPLFAWDHLHCGKKKPNLKHWYWEEKGKKLYRLEFVCDERQALLSDADHWGCVFHDSFVSFTKDEFCDSWKKHGEMISNPDLAAEAQQIMRTNWEKIFDLETDRSWGDPEMKDFAIQACLWKIELSQVTKVQPYISTGYKWKTIQPRFRCLHDKIQPPFDQYSLGNITTQKPSVQFA